jgi:hypothetical protein
MGDMPHVLIATPCYGGALSSSYFLSMLHTVTAVMNMRPDVHLSFYVLSNESLVTRARNTCVAHFLAQEGYTHLFFVDADIEFTPEVFLRVLDSGRDVACACYPQKVVRWQHVAAAVAAAAAAGRPLLTECELIDAGLNYNFNLQAGAVPGEDGFLKVDFCGTGFMVIRRNVFDVMRAAYPELKYVNDTLDEPAARQHNWLFFDTMLDPASRQYLSEDYAFCKRWRDLGGEVWTHAASPLTHVGTYRFEGKGVKRLLA